MEVGKTEVKLHVVLACLAGLVLSGCSSSLLGNKMGGPADVQNVPVGNPLSMPPDLSLPPPSQAASNEYQPNKATANTSSGLYDDASLAKPATTPVKRAPAAPAQDIYAQYGISKTKPDGTAKTPDELKAELKAAVLAKKKQANPGYGTVFNIGNVFKDE